ncbi:MAG: exodeoxyribonuclease V subunit gamma, partial [Thiotrichaceae bacterium]|nr:exodeoxyribonuclease V subunit gamma [Thiotrichaceae bacterium]
RADRYLFLETLLSAEQRFYISYIGRDINDNSEQMPSLLVTELMNYCQDSFSAEGSSPESPRSLLGNIKTQYPMQSFNERYYNGDFSTFNNDWWKVYSENTAAKLPVNSIDVEQKIPLDSALSELSLKQLKNFLNNPCKAFYNNRLNVYLELTETCKLEDEPFEFDNLEQYLLKKEQFDYLIKETPLASLFSKLKAMGQLPHGEFSHLTFNSKTESMTALADTARQHFQEEKKNITVEINFGELRLHGELTDHYKNGLVAIKTGKITAKNLLSLWVDHLCYCIAHAQSLNSTLLGEDRGVYFKEMPADYAYGKLKELIEIYHQGMEYPLAFFPESALEWNISAQQRQAYPLLFEEINFDTLDAAQTAALKKFDNKRGFSEKNDPYVARTFENLREHWHPFQLNAFNIFMPLLINITNIDYAEEQVTHNDS